MRRLCGFCNRPIVRIDPGRSPYPFEKWRHLYLADDRRCGWANPRPVQ